MNEMIPEMRPQRHGSYELLMGQLIIIVIVGILIAIGSGFWIGKYVGYMQGTSAATVEIPNYCSSSGVNGKIIVKCNELGNVSLDNLCQWASPDLKNKIKLVLVTT
ncbi:MAG: hypothetical protein V1839_02400 [archaeon]